MIPTKKLPEYLKGISVEPSERGDYEDAMSNGMRLVEYLRINRGALRPYDLLVMMKIETERAKPRQDILLRLKGKYNVERNFEEQEEIMRMFDR